MDYEKSAVMNLVVAFIFIFNFPDSVTPFSFNIPSFSQETTQIFYEGDATISNGAIRLIPTASYWRFRVGRASYYKPFHLHDASTGKLASFVTNFSFIIDMIDPSKLREGFAFFFVPNSYPIPPNSAGRGLGLFNSTTRRNQIVVVEFDTFSNSFDPPFTHIGINNGSIASSAYVKWDLRKTSGREGRVWISYDSATKNLSVICSYDAARVYHVSYVIDLKEVLPEWVRTGFSAASGPFYERNFAIYSWGFDSDLDEIGSKNVKKMKKTPVLIGATGLFLLILAGRISCLVIRKRRTKLLRNGHGNYALVSRDLERGTFPKRFTFEELEMATENFADHMRLGRGGSGSGHAYRGSLSDISRVVSVKKISTEAVDSEKVFINEVMVISRLTQRNLVQFIGWCQERENLLQVYDFMPNGSLDTHLFGEKKIALPWQARYRIAIGLASALHYLHEEAEQCVLHRDIKPANVFLDTDFGVKLGDFGVAKFIDPQLMTQTTGVVGTWDYIAPEYAYEGKATKESDMYSFGIVALEI